MVSEVKECLVPFTDLSSKFGITSFFSCSNLLFLSESFIKKINAQGS